MGGGGSGQGRRHGVAAGGSAWVALRAAWGCVGWSWGTGPCGWGKGVEGRWTGRLYQASSLGIAGPFPGPWRPVLGARGVPGDGAWHWDVRAPDTVSTPPIGSARALSSGASHPAPSPWVELGSTQGVVWCGVVWCGLVWCVVLCGVVLFCVVLCCVVSCCVVWCGVVRCGVVWCGVVCCGVVCCGVVWCGVVWCGVVWCGVVWCAEGVVTRRQWPGCLPTGTRKRVGLSVLCARRVYVCRSWPREGEPGRLGRLPLGDRPYSRSSRCTPSRSACWCRRSSCNAHAIVLPRPRRTLSSVGVPDPYGLFNDVAGELRACGVVWCGVVWCGVVSCGVEEEEEEEERLPRSTDDGPWRPPPGVPGRPAKEVLRLTSARARRISPHT